MKMFTKLIYFQLMKQLGVRHPPRLVNHAVAGRLMEWSKCIKIPYAVNWQLRETCWPGAAEWWSVKCPKGFIGEEIT